MTTTWSKRGEDGDVLRRRLVLILAVLAFSLASVPALAAPGSTDPAVSRQLAAVRAATAKYHDPATAIADGYLPTDVCVASPDGSMGMHYVNPGRVGALDPLRPDVLLYEPTPSGPRLVGVEYLQFALVQLLGSDNWTPWFDQAPPPAGSTFAPAPALFGQRFDGPMPGHEPGMPWHYDLHVWLWQANPDGIFSMWNPNVHCTAGE